MKNILSLISTLFFLVVFFTPIYAQENIRKEIENSLLLSRNAIIEGDLIAFKSSIDPLNPKSKITEAQWKQTLQSKFARKLLLRALPLPGKDTKFLTIKTKGRWAAYYALSALSDNNYRSLSVYLFRKSESGWRPAGKSYGLSKAKPGGKAAQRGLPAWTGTDDMLKTIETDQNFSLDKLIP